MRVVKVCCIQDVTEAQMAIDAGARALGLVSEMPSGWGPIPLETIAEIVRTIPPFVSSVLLTSRTTPEGILEQQRICQANAIQIVDTFPVQHYATLRAALPGVTLLQAVHVLGPESIDDAFRVSPYVDGVVLDTGSPHGETRVLGGTGKTHDWSISRTIIDEIPCPVFLAGGLKAHNVEEAIHTTKPYGIDLCTGVRTDTHLDPEKLRAFMEAVNRAQESR